MTRRTAGTDYAKFDKIDYSALAGEEVTPEERDQLGAATPEEQTRAYLKHVADVEAAKKRLAELEAEQTKAELRLIELEKQRKQSDRVMMAIALVLLVATGVVHWWYSGYEGDGEL